MAVAKCFFGGVAICYVLTDY